VIVQSTRTRRTLSKTSRHLRALMVGHLRDEKLPQTLFAAAKLIHPAEHILIDHIGAPLDEALAEQARATAHTCTHYRWLGALPHETTRRRIQAAHVLVHCSRMEGGAHVVMEAVCSGTPVLASRIDGNVGMLGADYEGYFAVDDAPALAALLRRAHHEPDFLNHLHTQCALRASLFAPQAERQALHQLVQDLLVTPTTHP
jgi:glycosyltransferase involved in cell wall biosynthesis